MLIVMTTGELQVQGKDFSLLDSLQKRQLTLQLAYSIIVDWVLPVS